MHDMDLLGSEGTVMTTVIWAKYVSKGNGFWLDDIIYTSLCISVCLKPVGTVEALY